MRRWETMTSLELVVLIGLSATPGVAAAPLKLECNALFRLDAFLPQPQLPAYYPIWVDLRSLAPTGYLLILNNVRQSFTPSHSRT
jgi:hypothetical protein